MEMFFLLITSWSGNYAVMPEKYNKEQCDKIIKDHSDYKCIPAPSFQLVTFVDPRRCKPNQSSGFTCLWDDDTLNQLDKRYPGYTCGGHGSECKLLKEEDLPK